MQESDLRHAAGAYLAGELDCDQERVFEALMARDWRVQQEHDFWLRMKRELPAAGRPTAVQAPGPELAEALHARLAKERVLRWDPWRWGGWAAAACLALLVSQFSLTQATYFEENGDAVQAVSVRDDVDPVRYEGQAVSDESIEAEPWLGLWTRPIAIDPAIAPGKDQALLVLQVAGNSPAAQVGVQPGDLLLDLGDCPMYSRWCIKHAIGQREPGSTVPLRFWSAEQQTIRQVDLALGALLHR
jgi:hypothetical protein